MVTAQTAVVLSTPYAPPLPLVISPPSCYETPVNSLWCLGLIRNGWKMAVEQVIIRVYLVNAEGTALAEKDTYLTQAVLAPGESLPYGVLFDSSPDNMAGPVATLLNASEVEEHVTHVSMEVSDLQSEMRAASYHVTGALRNNKGTPLNQLAVVVTLLDESNRVTGFRQWRPLTDQTLAPGASLPFELDVIPQGTGTTRVEISAEGRRN